MKITILFEHNTEEDGYEEVSSLSRSNVEDVYDLLDFFTTSAKIGGFTYWDRTGFSTDKGEQTWGSF